MRTDQLDFDLPPELIAQEPAADRAASRLLHYRRQDRSIRHRRFSELPQLLRQGDLLVFNDTKVLPARLTLRKSTGGLVEGLFLDESAAGQWRVMLKNVGSGVGTVLTFPGDAAQATVTENHGGGEYTIGLDPAASASELLSRVGRMPLPPYIKRAKERDDRDALDREHYQTVYAKEAGAVAAPTAGLHFTPELLKTLDAMGVERTFVTLHVGMGTFKPVTAETLDAHAMHSERYSISAEAAAAIVSAKRQGRRVIAVGTTSARVLESQGADGPMQRGNGETSIFIYPPYEWKYVSAMITNFHLPRSTLIAMIAALVGLEEQRRIYEVGIEERYRFFSYGDAMFVE
ncbi:MAG TPA: tRNA preQ1(34) S-adenosylmethionine ribosyltransferase-isomerase QueA [Tepidisphaeraceae bacterium]|jgi:S-adenosylmethionine:tRNA ribosyltransferase-isomerase